METYKVTVNRAGSTLWYQNDELHRLDGPAREDANGYKKWFFRGETHREDGPAVEYSNGGKEWVQNNKLHRLDGPAVVCASGYKAWYQYGRKHREDGPAIEWADGQKNWYIEGGAFTEQEFLNRDKVEVTIDGVTTFISKESAESVRKCITPVDSKNKCMTCKHNARLGFGNVFPLCIITSFKIVNPVFECEHYKE